VDSTVRGTLKAPGLSIDLGAVSAIYLRPYDSRELPEVADAGPTSEIWRHAVNIQETLITWAEVTPALVVNRPSAMAANGSKPYQAAWIRSLGFQIPETLVTTDPESAREFWLEHHDVVYKSLSGVRSVVSRLTAQHAARFEHISTCPTQFQQYVSGTDYRVHVVGEEVFACQVISEADDYRYSSEPVGLQACDLAGELAERCQALAAEMNLPVAGIDLRRTPEGEWYCFEVNPSPGFSYFQESTGQPIAEAVARLLLSPSDAGSTESAIQRISDSAARRSE